MIEISLFVYFFYILSVNMTAAGPFWITWWLSQCCLKRVNYKQIYLFFSWLFGRETSGIQLIFLSLWYQSRHQWIWSTIFLILLSLYLRRSDCSSSPLASCYKSICKLVVDPVTGQVCSQQNRECDVLSCPGLWLLIVFFISCIQCIANAVCMWQFDFLKIIPSPYTVSGLVCCCWQ